VPDLNLQIGATANDGWCYDDASFATSSTRMGRATYGYDAFLRFTSVTIPPGSTIDTAVLKVACAIASSATTMRLKVYACDEDNAAAPTDAAEAVADPRTTAGVDWDVSGSWSLNTWYDSPDISAVIQEVVDRGGWSSGNALMLLVDNDGSDLNALREIYDYGNNTFYAAKLDITYTPRLVFGFPIYY
jgi:type IV pilus assembly protein PilY1